MDDIHAINTTEDLQAATSALRAWFESQDMTPSDAAILMQATLALLIDANFTADKYPERIININRNILLYLNILAITK